MKIHRLGAAQVFVLLERNMRKTPHWNAASRADGIFTETCRKFLLLLRAAQVAIFLDNPSSKVSGDKRAIELVCVSAAGHGADSLIGQVFKLRGDLKSKAYKSGKIRSSGAFVWVPIRMGRSVMGVIETQLRGKRRGAVSKHLVRQLSQVLCEHFSALLQNVLDAQKRLELERRDSLTGLASGQELDAYLKEKLSVCWPRGPRRKNFRELSVIFMDLDRFKRVNDAWGHLEGSKLLADVGELLRTTVQYPERLIARYGGDEFVIVLVGAKIWEAESVAHSIRAAVASSKGLSRPITASLGLACLHAHVRKRDHQALLLAADKAMYEAKRRGRNRVVVHK